MAADKEVYRESTYSNSIVNRCTLYTELTTADNRNENIVPKKVYRV